MPVPLVSLLPDPPLPTDPEQVFDNKVGASLLAQQAMVPEMNTQAEFTNQRAIDADASAAAAAASEQAVEADRLEVVTRANEVATNTNTVVTRANEVATNTLQVANNTQQVATNAQAVADALASVADGPVASVAGQTGIVTLEQLRAAGIATQGGAETLTNKTVSSPIATGDINLDGSVRGKSLAVASTLIYCAQANYFTRTVTANQGFTFYSPPSGAYSFTLEVTHTAGTITWPTSVKWPGDTAPTLTAGKTHLFMFVTDDGGTRWRGACLADYVN